LERENEKLKQRKTASDGTIEMPCAGLTKGCEGIHPIDYLYIDVSTFRNEEEAVEFAGSVVEKIAPKKEVILVSNWPGYGNSLSIVQGDPNLSTTKITIYKDEPSANIMAEDIKKKMALAGKNVDRGRIVYAICEDDKWLKAFQSDIFRQILLETIGREDVIYLVKNEKCWNATAWVANLFTYWTRSNSSKHSVAPCPLD
jgi:hypothetical protein